MGEAATWVAEKGLKALYGAYLGDPDLYFFKNCEGWTNYVRAESSLYPLPPLHINDLAYLSGEK